MFSSEFLFHYIPMHYLSIRNPLYSKDSNTISINMKFNVNIAGPIELRIHQVVKLKLSRG